MLTLSLKIKRRTIEEKRLRPRNSDPIAFRTYEELKDRFDRILFIYKKLRKKNLLDQAYIIEPGQDLTNYLERKVEEYEDELVFILKTLKEKYTKGDIKTWMGEFDLFLQRLEIKENDD